MNHSCARRNPLVRGGTAQGGRRIDALDPARVPVDDRSTAELIRFAERYSRELRFYDADNVITGDWHPFFSRDVSAVLAALSGLPVDSFRAFHDALSDFLSAGADRPDDELASHFKLLFHLPVLLLAEVGRYRRALPAEHGVRGFAQRVVARELGAHLRGLVAWYRGALPPAGAGIFQDTPLDPADYNTTFDDADPRIQLPSAVTERIRGLPAFSALSVEPELLAGLATSWPDLFASVGPDPSPYEDSPGQIHGQIYDGLNYNLLDAGFRRLYQALERIAQEAERHLEESLRRFDAHAPHYGLWLAFLRLFRVGQDRLNGFARRHLDHYYRKVLRLRPRPAEPDRVHLLFELARGQREHLLRAGTLFRAGKDAAGKEVAYRLDHDLVINRARVASLRAVTVRREAGGTSIHAAPVADSLDGRGAPLSEDDPRWKPFGPATGPPDARLGFALADRRLFLREGVRTITVTLELERPLPAVARQPIFRCQLTTEDGWLEVEPRLPAETGSRLQLEIRLEGGDPPVVHYDPAVHGPGFVGPDPVLRVQLRVPEADAAGARAFEALRDARLERVLLRVAAEGLREVVLQSDAGALDPARPFLPFGSAPSRGSALVLGSSEVFSKRLAQLKLRVQWHAELTQDDWFVSAAPGDFQAEVHQLANGRWTRLSATTVALFRPGSKARELVVPDLSDIAVSAEQPPDNSPYDASATAGFLRLVLVRDFGHARHLEEKTRSLIALARGRVRRRADAFNSDKEGIPYDPYTPTIRELTVDYATMTEPPARYFHLHPFGQSAAPARRARLLPAFPHEGELYIGIDGLEPPQRLTLLFQVVDGSANPLKGETALRWDYLRGNDWVELEEQRVDDRTHNLTGSGVVGLAVPGDADTEHTILDAGLHWFRVSAAADADAVNELRSVNAQAARATFQDRGNDPDFLATPLSPESITKLEQSHAAVKKVVQPYASFGGRVQEADEPFYRRVSERLRHKDRAVTLWDYEHLVLERFPRVHRVRCINHTALHRDPAGGILADNEQKPGHVLVVPIPRLEGARTGNPLKPYTDTSTLVAIDRFLRERISPFVRLEVQNPKLEEVQVSFRVAFNEGIADVGFYKETLNEAVVRFLSPWAFEEGSEIAFGGRLHKASIIDFVEERPYVHHVEEFALYHKPDIELPDADWARVDQEVVEGTTARSVLVSHERHTIHEIPR